MGDRLHARHASPRKAIQTFNVFVEGNLEGLRIEVARSISSLRVTRIMSNLVAFYNKPLAIRLDNLDKLPNKKLLMLSTEEIHSVVHAFRQRRKFNDAYEFLTYHSVRQKQLQALAWEHQPVFWSDIEAGICKLTRRNSRDAAFIDELWQRSDFVYRFHRHAKTTPKGVQDLEKILEYEFISTIGMSKALHWIVRDRFSRPWGILSLVDISLIHKRAEVMLGVLPTTPFGLSTAAMLTLFQFFFKAMKFKKLYSFIYEDNPDSIKGTLHLGFKVEGRLRKHALDPRSGDYLDLIQTGALEEDVFNLKTERLMKRLLRT